MERHMVWKRAHIESDESLALDTLWPGMADLLGQLRSRATLILLTSRQLRAQAIKQPEGLGIAHMFSAIIAAPSDGRPASKLDALIPYLDQYGVTPTQVVLIGDTECEMAVAKALAMGWAADGWFWWPPGVPGGRLSGLMCGYGEGPGAADGRRVAPCGNGVGVGEGRGAACTEAGCGLDTSVRWHPRQWGDRCPAPGLPLDGRAVWPSPNSAVATT
jgi:hypothetical protein